MKPTSATDGALGEALRAAWASLSPGGLERFPVESDREPFSVGPGTAKAQEIPEVNPCGSRVPGVPGKNKDRSQHTHADGDADAWAAWLERAAIREFDGGMTRAQAEAVTAVERGPCPPEPMGSPGKT